MHQNNKGFTLIELMIVVAIIGILSAIAIPSYKSYVSKSELTSAIATLRALITPAELIVQEKGELNTSTDLSELGIDSDANPLGNLSIPTNNTLTFQFNDTSSINGASIIYSRSSTGWKCELSTTSSDPLPSLNGCN